MNIISKIFKTLFVLLPEEQHKKVFYIFLIMLSLALVELLGIATILPFTAVLMNPEVIEENRYLNFAFTFLNFESREMFLAALGAAFFIFIFASNVFKAYGQFAILRFSHTQNHHISMRLMNLYLQQPYSFFLQRNSSDLSKNILDEVSRATVGFIVPALKAMAKVLVVGLVSILLFAVNPMVAVLAVLTLGGAYLFFYQAMKRRITKLGQVRRDSNVQRYKLASEAFGGIKDIKILNKGQAYLDRFRPHSERFATVQATHQVFGALPRYFLEVLAFGGIVLALSILMIRQIPIDSIIPVVALYVFAGYRLLPAMQELFHSVTLMRFSLPAVTNLANDCRRLAVIDAKAAGPAGGGLPFRHELMVDGVSFSYPGSSGFAVQNVNLKIPFGSITAFVGKTGSGKTTMVDLVLGLLLPTKGKFSVDGKALDSNNISQWQQNIGYVPQHIFLSDESIAANVAFGLASDEIDEKRVLKALSMAQLTEFVETLERGIYTVVGERGVRLSGGQRQRIGIARALYREPKILILDEATSALDNSTEKDLMEAVHRLGGDTTIIMVAHRLSTVSYADQVVYFDKGQVVNAGSYDALLKESRGFQELVNAT